MFFGGLHSLERNALIDALKNPKVGLRIFKYLSKDDCHIEIEALHEAIERQINIPFFIRGKNSISKMLLPDIIDASIKGVDIDSLINSGYNPKQIREICYFSYPDIGILNHIDTSFEPQKIRLIGLLLIHDMDISTLEQEIPLILLNFDNSQFENLLCHNKDYFTTINFDFITYVCQGFNYHQIMEICSGHELNLDVTKYAKLEYSNTKMSIIRSALEIDVDIMPYIEQPFSDSQLQEILRGLEEKIDISRYALPNMPYERMRFIRRRLIRLRDAKKAE